MTKRRSLISYRALLVLLVALQPVAGFAQGDADGFFVRPSLLGDWGGLRSQLENQGVVFTLTQTSDLLGNVNGGVKRGVEYDGLFQPQIDVDLGKLAGWSGLSAHVAGYVLAKLEMNDQVYHLVKNTPKVTGFLGFSGKPQPISEAEAARILSTKAEADAAAPKAKKKANFEIGDSVKVLDGPFASFSGLVEEIDFEKSRVKVSVSIFGRATPVELDFEQVEKSK